MSDTQILNQLKFKVASLQSQLSQKQKALQEYQTVESEADNKIKAMNKMHAQKVKNLLNSIQVLKKEKASIEGLSKQHKRSKLIDQLNKEIGDQDLAIQVLRKWVYDKEGKEKGRQVCDEIIVKALTKGPDRIRPLSREELRIQIDRLKSINLNLQGKLKNPNAKSKNVEDNQDSVSNVSSVTEQSYVNHNDQMLSKMKQLQFENQNMSLQVNAKLKIIQKLKSELKESDKLKTDLQMLKNEAQISRKKVATYEKLMKQSKQNTNAKIVELYERQIKVEQLQMVSRENRDKLKQVQQSHTMLLQEMKVQKQQLQAEIQELKGENEQLILDSMSTKKRIDELKKIIKDMDDSYGKQKEDMKSKITAFQQHIQKIVAESKKYQEAYRNAQNCLFTQRALWVEKQSEIIQQLSKNNKSIVSNGSANNIYIQQIQKLSKQNNQLKQLLQGGDSNGGANDKVLMARLTAYEQKIKLLESKGGISGNQLYVQFNQLTQKYEDLLLEFENYKVKYGPKQKKGHRKQIINLTEKQKREYEGMSSGVSKLHLDDISSDMLDNFDSSLQYQFVINQRGEKVKMPKLTEADRQLLKLMTSDLWNFIQDDRIQKKMVKAAQCLSQEDEDLPEIDYKQMRKLKNLSNPKGTKVKMYEQELQKLKDISDSVSITSAMQKQLNKFDSDIDIKFQKLPKGSTIRPINTYNINDNVNINDASISANDDDISISSVHTGESNIMKKKKKVDEKASRITTKKGQQQQSGMQNSSDFSQSLIGSQALDSDVSSGGIRQSQLAMINSDIDEGFKKKK